MVGEGLLLFLTGVQAIAGFAAAAATASNKNESIDKQKKALMEAARMQGAIRDLQLGETVSSFAVQQAERKRQMVRDIDAIAVSAGEANIKGGTLERLRQAYTIDAAKDIGVQQSMLKSYTIQQQLEKLSEQRSILGQYNVLSSQKTNPFLAGFLGI